MSFWNSTTFHDLFHDLNLTIFLEIIFYFGYVFTIFFAKKKNPIHFALFNKHHFPWLSLTHTKIPWLSWPGKWNSKIPWPIQTLINQLMLFIIKWYGFGLCTKQLSTKIVRSHPSIQLECKSIHRKKTTYSHNDSSDNNSKEWYGNQCDQLFFFSDHGSNYTNLFLQLHCLSIWSIAFAPLSWKKKNYLQSSKQLLLTKLFAFDTLPIIIWGYCGQVEAESVYM